MKEITFTKEERNAIYIKALEIYITTMPSKLGLCFAVSRAANKLYDVDYNITYDHSDTENGINGMKEYFPEIYKHKPEDDKVNWFTFDTEGINKRIAILNQAIKETSI